MLSDFYLRVCDDLIEVLNKALKRVGAQESQIGTVEGGPPEYPYLAVLRSYWTGEGTGDLLTFVITNGEDEREFNTFFDALGYIRDRWADPNDLPM